VHEPVTRGNVSAIDKGFKIHQLAASGLEFENLEAILTTNYI
jgi:hypothetical protein